MEKEQDSERSSICAIYKVESRISGDYSFVTKKPLAQYTPKETVDNEPDILQSEENCIEFKNVKSSCVDYFVCKCTFAWESRRTKVINYYTNGEGSVEDALMDVKLWLVSKTQLLMELIADGDSDVALKYLENYLKMITELKFNCFMNLDEGFYVECFILEGYTSTKQGEQIE